MRNWIMSANPSIYDPQRAFAEQGYVDWKQTRNFEIGDVVYIYLTKPMATIRYRTTVEAVNIEPYVDPYWNIQIDEIQLGKKFMRLSLAATCDSASLAFDELKKQGLNYVPQSPGKIRDGLREYIESCFAEETI